MTSRGVIALVHPRPKGELVGEAAGVCKLIDLEKGGRSEVSSGMWMCPPMAPKLARFR